MITETTTLVHEFHDKRAIYEELEQFVHNRIKEIIKEESFFVMEVNSRVKTEVSLKNKIEKKSGKYSTLKQITDLCGVRIICYFGDTVDRIAERIKNEFDCDEKNSIDKRSTISETSFGYISLHIICSLSKNNTDNPDLIGIPFEIQIRSVLQHAWAEIEHDLGYKSSFGVPRPIRRNFSRVASLLEIADKEFIELRKESADYVISVRNRICANDCDDIQLDYASLNEYLMHNMLIVDFIQRLKDELQMEVKYTDPEICIKYLMWMNIYTLGDLNKIFYDNIYYIFARVKQLVEKYELDIMLIVMLVRFACEGELLRREETEDRIYRFYSIMMNDDLKIRRAMKQLEESRELR